MRLRIYFAAHGQEALQDLTMAAGITRDFEVFHQRGIVYHKIHDYAKVTPRAPLDCPEAPGVAAKRPLWTTGSWLSSISLALRPVPLAC